MSAPAAALSVDDQLQLITRNLQEGQPRRRRDTFARCERLAYRSRERTGSGVVREESAQGEGDRSARVLSDFATPALFRVASVGAN
jgi:hypothetical protein